VVSLGGDLPRFTSICAIDRRRVDGAYRLTGDGCLVGAERSADLRVGTRDEPSVSTSQGYDDVLVVAGVCDLGNRDVNGRWEVTSPRPARSLLDLAGGGSAIDVKVADVFAAQEIAERLAATTGLSAASWMRTSTRL
jgi:lipoprotein-releasing system permease protein